MIYVVKALTLLDSDSFAGSYTYKLIGYACPEDAAALAAQTVAASEDARWPLCHMHGWPLFKVKLLEITPATALMERTLAGLQEYVQAPD